MSLSNRTGANDTGLSVRTLCTTQEGTAVRRALEKLHHRRLPLVLRQLERRCVRGVDLRRVVLRPQRWLRARVQQRDDVVRLAVDRGFVQAGPAPSVRGVDAAFIAADNENDSRDGGSASSADSSPARYLPAPMV